MSDRVYESLTHCPICNSKNFELVLDLGNQPPANSLRRDIQEKLPAVPLRISRCSDCTLIFLNEQVDPKYLFSHYVWVTGTSKTAEQYSVRFQEEVSKRLGTNKGFVVEVASNDGTFLKRFKAAGHKVLGVDPAANIAAMAVAAGVPTKTAFFGEQAAKEVVNENGQASLVFARNVIPHVKDIHGVIQGMADCLSNDGLGIIEFHYAKIILDELHYDSIYHEHVYYFTLKSISRLLEMHGLHSFDVFESPISGGSLVLMFRKSKSTPTPALQKMQQEEERSGVNSLPAWQKFAANCERHRKSLKNMIETSLAQGKKIVGYGASARSSTMLNFCGIGANHLTCVADQSELKQGLLTPGTDVRIKSPDEAFAGHVDTVLLLAWNFKDELMKRIRNDFKFKGDVIIPLPSEPKVMSL